jgi:uncharacterized protein (DUF924 family)
MDTAILREIHRYWFGELKSPEDFPKDKTASWFTPSDAVDREIRDRFGKFIPEAAKVDWRAARLAAEEAVALVVLLDQFPRNMFRASAESFAYDPKARDISRQLIAGGLGRFYFIERVAIGIPFEHSEDVADQDYGQMLYGELAVIAPEPVREFCRVLLDYGAKHREIIRKFGRFPHRNALLGRESTPEELAFLAEMGRGY